MTDDKSSAPVSDGGSSAPPPSLPKKFPVRGTIKSRIDYIPMDKDQGFLPRQYQTMLYEMAKKQNSIICVGNGSSKAFIPIMLMKELSYQVRSPFDKGGKRTVMLVPKVVMVKQEAEMIREETDLTVGAYIGSMGVEKWTREEWEREFVKNQVLVMTPDVFVKHADLPMEKVNLLILDEAHRAMKDHPYNQVMNLFNVSPNPPRILGLAASLINSKAKVSTIEKSVEQLEKNLKSRVITAGDIKSVNKYGARPSEHLSFFTPDFSLDERIKTVLDSEIKDILTFISHCDISDEEKKSLLIGRNAMSALSDSMDKMGMWIAKECASMCSRELAEVIAMKRFSNRTIVSILSCMKTFMDFTVTQISKHLDSKTPLDQIIESSSPKVQLLFKTLKSFHPEEGKGKNMCGIVFARKRGDVKLLAHSLRELARLDPSNYGFLRVEYVVGETTSGNRAQSVSSKRQEDILARFRRHEYNVLVATSVLEEGLDVPRCNLVIRYDFPRSVREYIQSKGRARAEGGRYILFCPECGDERKRIEREISDYRRIEQMINSSAREVEESDEEEGMVDMKSRTEEGVVDMKSRTEDEFGPFVPGGTDGCARCTMNNAIQIINRYCMKLPSDSFTKLVPRNRVEEVEKGLYVCHLTLPINSPIRTVIRGRPMEKKKLAKKSAAYEAVIRLHQMKELDDNLLPVGKDGLKGLTHLGLEPFGDEYTSQGKDGARPGTTKRRQFYKKRVAEILEGSPPEPGVKCYLYIFGMKLTCPIPEEQNTRGRKIHDPADSSRFFGLLIPNQLPPLCDFPVFTRAGEVMITIQSTPTQFIFTQQQLHSVSNFHHYTFHDVLHLDKYPMKFHPVAASTNYFLVPVLWNQVSNPDPVIDWNFMDRVAEYKCKGEYEPSEEERKSFVFKREEYEDAVIKPWYRQNKIQFYYYVAEICDEYNPRSTFPDKEYSTFEKYYQQKYRINVMNHEQPLLDVDHTSARLNLLTPRFVNRKGITLPMSTAKTKKEKRENAQLKQILIPELCVLHPFPASFWRKTVTLPCILYRLNSLLLADQLRQLIAKHTGIGSLQLPPHFKWPDLNFGWTLADVLDQEKHSTESKEKHPSLPISEKAEPAEELIDTIENGSNQEDSDFVIDVFDPQKYTIKDEDDLIAEELDLTNINFGGVFDIGAVIGQPLGDWDRKPRMKKPTSRAVIRELDDDGNVLDDDGNVLANDGNVLTGGGKVFVDDDYADFEGDDISVGGDEDHPRVGSPSNFEALKPWDQEEEDRFVATGANLGLAKISAPDEFNIEKLCEDIKKGKPLDDDFEDSDEDFMDDEEEEFTDESVTSHHPTTPKKTEPKKEEFNSILSDGIVTFVNQSGCERKHYSDFGCENSGEENEDVTEESSEIMKFLDAVFPDQEVDGSEECDESVLDEEGREETNFGELLPKDRRDAAKEEEKPAMKFDAYKDDEKGELGPSPSMILQALTMSNASDGINLERLETVGDSFLKYSVTAFLYVSVENLHEGKLSYMRSRIISNFNLYRVGRRKGLGEYIIGSKFEPNDNWLPPGYVIPQGLEQALIELGSPASAYDLRDLQHVDLSSLPPERVREEVLKRKSVMNGVSQVLDTFDDVDRALDDSNCIPYSLLSQQSIPDKSIADCVEALIGAYLLHSGPKGAILFMKWLGLQVMPKEEDPTLNSDPEDPVWHHLPKVRSPLIPLTPGDDYEARLSEQKEEVKRLYEGAGLDRFEKEVLRYEFKDKAYLVQAFTHNSYFENKVTDCYQRLEFLGDALLDFLVTRLLYDDPRKHSPGTLTDLRSALVNNTFFASLAVEYEFHKYLKSLSHDLFNVISKFVKSFTFNTKSYRETFSLYVGEGETESLDDVEVPKALGDIFESVAGAIYLDSGMSLDAVWRVYYRMMKPEIDHFSDNVPKSPIRELLEMEPQNAQFGRPDLIPGKKVRVCVEVFGEGPFYGVGRNKRIAKCAAAKRALRVLRPKRKAI